MEPALTFEAAQALVQRDAELDAAITRVAALDFARLRTGLAAEHSETELDEIEELYRMFLALCIRYPDRKLSPTGPVDAFWHAHILDTTAYAADCEQLFGGLLHHFPYFGTRGPEDRADLERAFADTLDLYVRHFGVDPTAGDHEPRSCRPQRCP